MKKILYGMMAATMIFATSCENELEVGAAGEESMVSFTIATPDMGSRAYSDGTTATQLQYAVYDANGTYLSGLTGSKEFTLSTTVNLKLTTGNTYSVVFWAAAPNAPYTVDFANKTMTVNYTNAVSNDENRDAFYAKETFTVTGAQTETITLKRPFAQLNIGTSDYEASTSAGYTPTHSAVTVKNLKNTLNFFNGEVSGADSARVFASAAIPAGQEFPVAGYEYLAMNYLLVGADKETVDVEFTYAAGSDAKTRTVGSVPVQRNHRTNIYGELLTSEVDINVEIKPEYEEPNNNVGVPYVTIGDEIYESFAAAFAAAQDGATLVLQGESVLKATANQNLFKVEKNITIDLNGNALIGQIPDVTKNTAVFEVVEGGSLTIQGEGDVRVVTAKAPNVLAAMINNNGGVVNLKGGNWTMVALDYPDALIPTFVDNNSNVNDATLNIYGGTYTFHRNLFRNFANAASHNGYATVATMNIYGGTFNGRPDDAGAIWNQKPSASTPAGAGVINVMGGTFNNVVIDDDFDGIATVNNATELAEALNDNSVRIIQLGAGEFGTIVAKSNKTIIGSADAKVDCVNLNGAQNLTLSSINFDAATAKMGYDKHKSGTARQVANIITGDNENNPNIGARNLVIDGCTFTGTFADGGAAIAFTDRSRPTGASGNITIKNCTFNTVGAYYDIYGYYTGAGQNGYGNFAIENNKFKSETQGKTIYLGQYASNITVEVNGNVFETKESINDALYLQAASNYTVSYNASGNTFAQ